MKAYIFVQTPSDVRPGRVTTAPAERRSPRPSDKRPGRVTAAPGRAAPRRRATHYTYQGL